MRKLISIVLIFCLVGCLCGCTRSDDSNVVVSAIIKLPDGTIISGNVDSYQRWTSSSTEIKIDGVIYDVHPANCVFIKGA